MSVSVRESKIYVCNRSNISIMIMKTLFSEKIVLIIYEALSDMHTL
jgi:hypothetical protein